MRYSIAIIKEDAQGIREEILQKRIDEDLYDTLKWGEFDNFVEMLEKWMIEENIRRYGEEPQ